MRRRLIYLILCSLIILYGKLTLVCLLYLHLMLIILLYKRSQYHRAESAPGINDLGSSSYREQSVDEESADYDHILGLFEPSSSTTTSAEALGTAPPAPGTTSGSKRVVSEEIVDLGNGGIDSTDAPASGWVEDHSGKGLLEADDGSQSVAAGDGETEGEEGYSNQNIIYSHRASDIDTVTTRNTLLDSYQDDFTEMLQSEGIEEAYKEFHYSISGSDATKQLKTPFNFKQFIKSTALKSLPGTSKVEPKRVRSAPSPKNTASIHTTSKPSSRYISPPKPHNDLKPTLVNKKAPAHSPVKDDPIAEGDINNDTTNTVHEEKPSPRRTKKSKKPPKVLQPLSLPSPYGHTKR